jgi:RimJ/RimL family protein N-acetyltransferase
VIEADHWQTERLDVRPLEPADADEVFELLDDVALHEFIGDAPLARDELAARYERLAQRISPDGRQVWANWTLRRLPDGPAVGTLQATLPSAGPDAGPAEVAWVIGRVFQRQGYAAEAAVSLVERLQAAGWEIVAHVHPAHLASQGVAVRAGLRPTEVVVDGEIRYASR